MAAVVPFSADRYRALATQVQTTLLHSAELEAFIDKAIDSQIKRMPEKTSICLSADAFARFGGAEVVADWLRQPEQAFQVHVSQTEYDDDGNARSPGAVTISWAR